MKKIVLPMFVGCLAVLGITSCYPDKARSTNYTYINQTASTITIECYYGWVSVDEGVNPDDLYKTLIILPGEENTVIFDDMTFVQPFGWLNTNTYLLVKNEKVKVFDNGKDDSLLGMETYTLTSASDTERYYEYIFTDDYFKDGKTIE